MNFPNYKNLDSFCICAHGHRLTSSLSFVSGPPDSQQHCGSECVILHVGETLSTTKEEVCLLLSLLESGLKWGCEISSRRLSWLVFVPFRSRFVHMESALVAVSLLSIYINNLPLSLRKEFLTCALRLYYMSKQQVVSFTFLDFLGCH